jgi:hypothetical protein
VCNRRRGLIEFRSLHELKTKAGATYYFVADVLSAVSYNEFAISQADSGRGKVSCGNGEFWGVAS